jgi:hypothetical protein
MELQLMLIDQDDLVEITSQAMLARFREQVRLDRIAAYCRGKQDPPYTPKGVNAEYRWIARKAKRNFLPLIISVVSQNLHVDGYRPTGYTANQTMAPQTPQPQWEAFRANRMVSRQHGVHRSVIKYGASYVVVLPGQMSTDEEQQADVPVIRPVSPRRMTAFYADDVDDEWPQFAIEVKTVNLGANKAIVQVSVYDEDKRYILVGDANAKSAMQMNLRLASPDDPTLGGQDPVAAHGLGLCPIVRFLYETDLDGEDDCSGEIEPLMSLQDQINFDTFNLMISTQFAAFRQRWVTGMAPVDEEGREQAPFRPGVDRVWASEDATTKFGDFAETGLAPYADVREAGIRHMSTISQVPPYHLLGQVANLSAEALAAARDGLDRKIEELQAGLTDPWRNTFRLSALASGDKEGWNDLFGTIVWRDTSARAFGATIDGLTKAAQMLGVPAEELWSRIPGATADDVASWQLAAQREKAQALVQQAVQASQQRQQQQLAPGMTPGNFMQPNTAQNTAQTTVQPVPALPAGTPATPQ